MLVIHLNQVKEKRVSVVSFKSWQSGFDVDFLYEHFTEKVKQEVRVGTSDACKKFRELADPISQIKMAKEISTEQRSFERKNRDGTIKCKRAAIIPPA